MQEREKIMDTVTFMDFVLKYEEQIRGVSSLLAIPFEGTISGLEKQIGTLSSKMEFLSWCLAYAEELLSNARHHCLVVKRKDITEMDRSIALDFSTSKETLFRDWIESLCDDIDKYLSNAQSVLATKRAELNRFGHGGE